MALASGKEKHRLGLCEGMHAEHSGSDGLFWLQGMRAELADHLRILQATSRLRTRIHEYEVVSRAGQFVEPPSVEAHVQTRPVIDHHRSRHTIHTASRTMRFDILLSPSVRSTKTIGISAIWNPFFHALKLISI